MLWAVLSDTLLAKKKYLALADKEIASMKSMQKQHDENILKLHGIKVQTIKKEEKSETKTPKQAKKNKNTYTDYTHEYAPKDKEPRIYASRSGITLIDETTFAESDNNYQSLQYYSEDKVVADMDDNCISQYLNLIGPAELWETALKLDGRAVYIRNENSEMDYEILYKDDKWSDVATPTQKSAALTELDSKQDEDPD